MLSSVEQWVLLSVTSRCLSSNLWFSCILSAGRQFCKEYPETCYLHHTDRHQSINVCWPSKLNCCYRSTAYTHALMENIACGCGLEVSSSYSAVAAVR